MKKILLLAMLVMSTEAMASNVDITIDKKCKDKFKFINAASLAIVNNMQCNNLGSVRDTILQAMSATGLCNYRIKPKRGCKILGKYISATIVTQVPLRWQCEGQFEDYEAQDYGKAITKACLWEIKRL